MLDGALARPAAALLRLVILAGGIVAVGVALWLVDVDWPIAVLGIALAWLIASLCEWLASREAETRRPPVDPRFTQPPRTVPRLPARTETALGAGRPAAAPRERLAREKAPAFRARAQEWSCLFVYPRELADVSGLLRVDVDGLVRESFAGRLERLEHA